jgi:hypothetical protein
MVSVRDTDLVRVQSVVAPAEWTRFMIKSFVYQAVPESWTGMARTGWNNDVVQATEVLNYATPLL